MELIFREIYYTNGTKMPVLIIECSEKEEINNLKFSFKDDIDLYLDINNGCLNNYNLAELVNKIFNVLNTDFIDKEIWKKFLDYRAKNAKGVYTSYFCPEPHIAFQDDKLILNNSYKTKMLRNINLENIKNIYKDCEKVIEYYVRFNTEEQYCHYLLNIIFGCNFNFKIKKCNLCDKPFITYNQNFQTCNRLYKNNITCNKYYEKIRKQHQYDEPIKHLIKNVRDKLKGNEDVLYKFNQELSEKKEEFINDNKSFINWILNDYYYTDEGRKKIIERLNLSKYL